MCHVGCVTGTSEKEKAPLPDPGLLIKKIIKKMFKKKLAIYGIYE